MTNARSFPLLCLPSLAREHIVHVMDVREQKDWNSQWFYTKIFLNGSNDEISDPASEFQLNVEDTKETSIELSESLNGHFRITNFSVDFLDVPNEYTKRFVDVLRKLKISIYELGVSGEDDETDNEMYTWVMDNCQDAKRLENRCTPTREFKWDSQKPFTPEYCYLQWAPWLTIDHLTRIFINCRFFQSWDLNAHLTEAELNQFVKVWIENSKLEFVSLSMKNKCRIQPVLRDIAKEPVREAVVENALQRFHAGDAYKIKQKSGNEAVVFIEEDYNYYWFHITTHFKNRKCDFWNVEEEEEEEELESEEDEDEEFEDEEDEEVEEEEEEEEEEDN